MFPATQGAPRKSRAKLFAVSGALVVVAIIVIAVVASRKDPATEGYNDLWLITLEKAKDKMCACKDDACLRAAMSDMDSMHKKLEEHLDLNGDDAKRAHGLLKDIEKCVGKGAGGEDDNAFNDVMDDLRDLRAKMCKCKDAACAAQVKADYEAATSQWKSKLAGATVSKDDQKMLANGITELLECEQLAKTGRN